jgi:hypothetical protein
MGHDILLWGTYYFDLIYSGLEELPSLGKEVFSQSFEALPGGCFTTAVALRRLGVDVAWACDFGNDFFSSYVLRAAQDHGINQELFLKHSFPIRRVTTALSHTKDRAFISFADDFPCTPILDVLRRDPPRWILLPHLHYGDSYREFFTAAHQAGARIYMDCQSTPATLSTHGVADAIRSVEVFAPNAAEALKLTGAHTAEGALTVLAELAPLIVIKLGDQGAIARQAGATSRVGSLPVQVLDTTGAGDCFNAGFMYGLLRGAPVEVCLEYANLCGAISTTAHGGKAAPFSHQLEAAKQRGAW